MTRLFTVALLAGALAAPALAQDAATMVCKDYAALDDAGKMAILAELQSANAEMATNMSSEEIATGLNTDCAANPDKLLQDAAKELKKM